MFCSMCSAVWIFYVWGRDSVIGLTTRIWSWSTSGILTRFPMSRRSFDFVPSVQTSSEAPLFPCSVGAVISYLVLTKLLSTCAENVLISAFGRKQVSELLWLSERIRWVSFHILAVSPPSGTRKILSVMWDQSDIVITTGFRRTGMDWLHQIGPIEYVSFTAGGRLRRQDSDTSIGVHAFIEESDSYRRRLRHRRCYNWSLRYWIASNKN
jgi:hypothetical protein